MRKYKLYQIDSFTDKKFFGNPAGVVYDAKELTDEEMQKIAREMNNSETAFIFLERNNEYDVQVRFFTPSNEVPICGHATIAAHYVIALENSFTEKKIIKQKTGAGILEVEIEPIEKSYTMTMTQGEISFGDIIENENLDVLIDALGIAKSDLINEAPVQIVSTGHSKVMIGIKKYNQLHYLKPDMKKLKELSELIKCNGYFVFTFDTGEEGVLTKGRMFAPAIGIEEDPVTGNANGPLGAYIVKYKLAKISGDKFRFVGKQGMSIKRDGQMTVEVTIKNENPEKVKITGKAVTVFKTELIVE